MTINDFKNINITDIADFQRCLGGKFNNSESSFSTIYMWQHYADVKYCIEDDNVFSLYKNKQGKYASFMPYGKDRNSAEVVDKLINFYESINHKLTLNLCTVDFVDFLRKSGKYSINVSENRNSFDYVYYTKDLIELKGKKFHSKKNHFNSFTKKYPYTYCKYDSSLKNSCIDFCSDILKEHYKDNINGFNTEMLSINKTFESLDILGLKCGILFLDNRIIALSVGERLNNEYALIHIEKADYKYREAYAVINKLFLENEFSDTIYVNREEDMGIDGLKRAKKSYNPCKMIEKYTINFY